MQTKNEKSISTDCPIKTIEKEICCKYYKKAYKNKEQE